MENTKPYFNIAHLCKIYKLINSTLLNSTLFNTINSTLILSWLASWGQNIFHKFCTGNDINLQKYVFLNMRENLYE